MIKEIPGFEPFLKEEPIHKGWSKDKKFYIETISGKKLLLRVSDPLKYEETLAGFQMMKRAADLGIPMSQPLAFGKWKDTQEVYSLFTWCEGQEAEELLPQLSQDTQYALGLQAGEILKKLHSLPAPQGREAWEKHFNRKIDLKMEAFRTCGISFEGADKIIAYIEAHRSLLNNRPQCYQHGDYHIGNMVITRNLSLAIIDFNRWDFGDPWEEFNRIVWSAAVSPYFATGQLNGYFHGRPPMAFFQCLALYTSCNTISSIPWAISFGEEEVATMKRQAQQLLMWFDQMENPVPTWYLGK